AQPRTHRDPCPAQELGRGEHALAGELHLVELEGALARRDDEALARLEHRARRARTLGDVRAPHEEVRVTGQARDRARPGVHGAHAALERGGGFFPVEAPVLLRELLAVRDARGVLWRVARATGFDELERLEHELARPLGEAREELAGRLARAHR